MLLLAKCHRFHVLFRTCACKMKCPMLMAETQQLIGMVVTRLLQRLPQIKSQIDSVVKTVTQDSV